MRQGGEVLTQRHVRHNMKAGFSGEVKLPFYAQINDSCLDNDYRGFWPKVGYKPYAFWGSSYSDERHGIVRDLTCRRSQAACRANFAYLLC